MMDDPTPVAGDAGAPPAPTPSQRLAAAADEIVHDARTMMDKAASTAGDALERLGDEADDARERVGDAAENVVEELRGIGSRLAAALQAAASTPEAEGLKNDVREGAQRLVNELQAAIKSSPIGRMGKGADAAADGAAGEGGAAVSATPSGQRVGTTVRIELANALRSLNRVLDRLAGQIERPAAVVDTSAQPAPSAPSDDAPTA